MNNRIVLVLTSLLLSTTSFTLDAKQETKVELSCNDFSWQDVVVLVEPYLDESLHTAIVMQGINSNYDIALAASMAFEENQPQVIKTILTYLINAKC